MKPVIQTLIAVFTTCLLCSAARAQPGDAGKLVGYLRGHFGNSSIGVNTDLHELMIEGDLDLREIYRGAGLKNFDRYTRGQVIESLKACEVLTVGCAVKVLP